MRPQYVFLKFNHTFILSRKQSTVLLCTLTQQLYARLAYREFEIWQGCQSRVLKSLQQVMVFEIPLGFQAIDIDLKNLCEIQGILKTRYIVNKEVYTYLSP